jgi:hypothetical protein
LWSQLRDLTDLLAFGVNPSIDIFNEGRMLPLLLCPLAIFGRIFSTREASQQNRIVQRRIRMTRSRMPVSCLAFVGFAVSVVLANCGRAQDDPSTIHICTQLTLAPEHQDEAAEVADRVSPTDFSRSTLPKAIKGAIGNSPKLAVQIAALWSCKWQNGAEIRVGFLNGEPAVQQKIEHYAHMWESYANIKFKFGAADPQIRIKLRPGGSSSYIGTDALSPSLNGQPTMYYGWLSPTTSDDEYSRVVLHEFGHALGAIHEHQHPDSGIPWNKPKVYDYYAATQVPPWTHEDVENNIFNVMNRSWLQYGSYDKKSIMHYAIPKELTDGVFEVGWNRDLSDLDKTVMATIYPAAP